MAISFSSTESCNRGFSFSVFQVCHTPRHLECSCWEESQSLLDCVLPLAMQFWCPSCTPRVCLRSWSLLGVRVGEATNPGPPGPVPQPTLHHFWSTPGSTPAADAPAQPELGDVLSITVASPTAILSKLHEVLELKSDLSLMSETSAVVSTQTTFAKQLRPHGYKALWSAPVEPHHSSPGRPESRRGCAVGCVVITSLPSHASTKPFPEELWHTQRVAEATVRVGGFAFRAMAIYGYPANHCDSAMKNQELLSMALKRLATCKLPFLLGGDFNCDVTSLPCWRGFEELGCSELHALYKSCCNASLPATCKGATAWDSAIRSPTLTKLWRSAKVDTDSHLFDAHAPVTFQLQVSLLRPAASTILQEANTLRRCCPFLSQMLLSVGGTPGSRLSTVHFVKPMPRIQSNTLCPDLGASIGGVADCGKRRLSRWSPAFALGALGTSTLRGKR